MMVVRGEGVMLALGKGQGKVMQTLVQHLYNRLSVHHVLERLYLYRMFEVEVVSLENIQD